jgi:MFS family permease
MLGRFNFGFTKDAVWSKVITLSLVLFFVFLGDAILSFWVPNLIQESLKSAAAMGFVMSFSSVIGLGADLIFPQLLQGATVRKLLLVSIITGILFPVALLGGLSKPTVVIFLYAMAVWGIFYEFLGFANQQFVADSVPLRMRPGAWGVLRVSRDLAYFLGPMLAGWLLLRGEMTTAVVAIVFVIIGLMILLFSGKMHDRPMEIDIKEVNFVKELEHWKVLFKHVWPIIILSIFLGLIDTVFWTTGAIWTEHLARQSFWGGFFLPFYTLPALFMGFVVAKWGIFKGKKKMALRFLIGAGLFLSALGLSDLIAWQLVMVFLSSMMLAVVYPLTDGVYTDVTARMGRERRHMIGLSSSTSTVAYIIGPILAGVVAEKMGVKMTFVVAGMVTVLVASVLLLITPKKLKLPQKEIGTWAKK